MATETDIARLTETLVTALAALPSNARINTLNAVRARLASVSPLVTEPVDCVLWVPAETVQGNDWNPNTVAPPEMALLEHSIRTDGFTQPIVAFDQGARSTPRFEVVDGFHRNRVGRESPDIRERLGGRLPVAVVNAGRSATRDRMAATVRHNRARGVHGIQPMSALVARLYFAGWGDKRIARELGMDRDEVLRLKQATGLGALFADRAYSRSWTVDPGASAPDLTPHVD